MFKLWSQFSAEEWSLVLRGRGERPLRVLLDDLGEIADRASSDKTLETAVSDLFEHYLGQVERGAGLPSEKATRLSGIKGLATEARGAAEKLHDPSVVVKGISVETSQWEYDEVFERVVDKRLAVRNNKWSPKDAHFRAPVLDGYDAFLRASNLDRPIQYRGINPKEVSVFELASDGAVDQASLLADVEKLKKANVPGLIVEAIVNDGSFSGIRFIKADSAAPWPELIYPK